MRNLPLAFGLVLLASAAASAQEGIRIYDSLRVVRENQALLGTPLCVFVGYFPEGEDEDWAMGLVRMAEVVAHADQVTFVRHRRSRVLDLDERYLRERGLPPARSWEGAVVIDLAGEGVRAIAAPVTATRLALNLKTAIARGVGPRAQRFFKREPPAFAFEVPDGLTLMDLDPEGPDDLVLRSRDGAFEVRLASRRIGPSDGRGEAAVLEEIAYLRRQRGYAAKSVEEKALSCGRAKGVRWCYALKDGGAARVEALLGIQGDLYVLVLGSEELGPGALVRRLEALLAAWSPGEGEGS